MGLRGGPAVRGPAVRVSAIVLGACLWLSACAAGTAPGGWPPTANRGPCAVSRTNNVSVPMRDGTILRADVYRPATPQPVPVILYRTQYYKNEAQVQPSRYQSPDWFASHCYLVV
ncbi:MAG: CocE/NonD family hydrolase, partial [Pseudonocardiaceae bacterium]